MLTSQHERLPVAASGREANIGPAAESAGISESEIRAQLDRIVASRGFAGSERLRRFIRWTVEQTLAGQSEPLKQYAIAREVFDRKPDFDPRIDSIVRTEAQRLRRRLAQYYETDGATDEVVISFAPGGYVPSFTRREPPPAIAQQSEPEVPVEAPDRTCIAVLPFTNLSGQPEQDYLCQGITEAIIDRLAGLRGLRVTARTSAFVFADAEPDLIAIARNLGVGTAVQGSVRIAGDRARISVRIADTHTATWIWARTFDCGLDALFAVEDEISEAVAGSLRVQLSEKWHARGATPSPEVYSLYLRGRYAWNNITVESCGEAAAYYNRAIALDPNYAEPYAGLSDAYNWLMFLEQRPPSELMAVSRRMAQRAIELDEHCSEAFVALGTLTGIMGWQWEEGEQLIRHGIELRPSSLVAHVQAAFSHLQRGSMDQSRKAVRRALELDPLSMRVHRMMAIYLYGARQYESALASVERALTLGPNVPDTHYQRGIILLQLGRYDQAIAAMEWCQGDSVRGQVLGTLVMANAAKGRRAAAENVLEELTTLASREYVSPAGFVYARIGLGDTERALAALNEAVETHTAGLIGLVFDARLDPLRGLEGFGRILERVNLADSRRA